MSIITPANNEPLLQHNQTMRYRPLGQTGLMVSALSFGCMRLTEDQETNTKLVARAVDLGVNYFETTRGYCGGQCQHRTAPGLVNKTKGVIVSGKAGLGPDTTDYLFRKEVERQLDILGLSHFKFFQVGWFSWGSLPHLIKPGGAWDAIRRARAAGLIQHVGFTGHDSPENFIKCVETGLFDCITVPYNLINRQYEPLIKRCGALGVGVVAMCPVAGGVLSYEADKIKHELKTDLPTTTMALRFVLSNPDISTACSGMHTLEQLEQNVRTVSGFDPASGGDFAAMCAGLDRLRQVLGDKFCTWCRYCQPCPQGIDIPRHMNIYLNWKCFGLAEWTRRELASVPKEKNARACTDCGECEKKCPNTLSIRKILKELAALG